MAFHDSGFAGIHSGSLRDPASAKKEREIAERLAQKMSKAELAQHLSTVILPGSRTAMDAVFYEKNHTKKELVSLAVTAHIHDFNIATDNYQ